MAVMWSDSLRFPKILSDILQPIGLIHCVNNPNNDGPLQNVCFWYGYEFKDGRLGCIYRLVRLSTSSFFFESYSYPSLTVYLRKYFKICLSEDCKN